MLSLLLLSNRAEEIAFLQSRLNRQGYRVVIYDRPIESLESCLEKAEQIDAAFLPARDIGLIRELRGHLKTKDSTIICFQSQTSQLVLEDPNVRDCDLVIKRPNTQEELLQALVDALQAKGLLN